MVHTENRTEPIISFVFTDDPMTKLKCARQFLEFTPHAKHEIRTCGGLKVDL